MTKRIKIVITDNGKGMDSTFVRDKLGEPWAKEDNYATGSGLSVHLAYRIIDLMGGHMEISSAPGQGCRVELEVPVPRRVITMADSSKDVGDIRNPDSDSPAHLAKRPEEFAIGKKVVFIGFDREGPGAYGRQALGEALEHQYTKLGCELADFETAELAIVDGRLEETDEGIEMIGRIKTDDIVFLVGNEHERFPLSSANLENWARMSGGSENQLRLQYCARACSPVTRRRSSQRCVTRTVIVSGRISARRNA